MSEPTGVRASLLRLSSGSNPGDVPEACRSRLLSIAVMMIIVAMVSSIGLLSLFLQAGMGDSLATGTAAVLVALTLATFILAFDRWILTSVNPNADGLVPLVRRGLHGAWERRAERLRAEAAGKEGEDLPEESEDDERLLRDYDALLAQPVGKRKFAPMFARLLVTIPLALIVSHGIDLWWFDDEIRNQAQTVVQAQYDADVARANADLSAQIALPVTAETARIGAKASAEGLLEDANERFDKAKRYCPRTTSPGYEGSVCQTTKQSIRDQQRIITENSTPITAKQQPYKNDIKSAQDHVVDVQNELDGLIEAQRGLLADVEFLVDYLGEHPGALITYLVIFFMLIGIDLSPVMLKLSGWNDAWDQHQAARALEARLAHGHELATSGLLLPERARIKIQVEHAQDRRRLAESVDQAEAAEARHDAARDRRETERAERQLAVAEHGLAMQTLEREGQVRPRVLSRVLSRIAEFFPSPPPPPSAEPRQRPTAAGEPGESEETTEGLTGDPDPPSWEDPLSGVILEPTAEVLAQGTELRGNQRWIVDRQLRVAGRTAANNGIYQVHLAGDGKRRGFLKLYVLPPATAPKTKENNAFRARAANEARALNEINPGSVNHFVPILYDRHLTSERQRWWTITEFCRRDAYAWAHLSREIHLIDVLQLMTDVLKALSQSRMVHGDIKPRNILVVEETPTRMQFRLTDWETAYQPADGRPSVVQRATPGYAAPDVVEGSTPRPHDDLYSLGATVWWLCTGKLVGESEGVGASSRGAQLTEQSQLRSALKKNDLFWLAVHRHHGNDGCYPLNELLPRTDISNFCALIDRLLTVPREERSVASSPNVVDIAQDLIREVQEIRYIVEEREEMSKRRIVVGHAHYRPPRRNITIDDAWRKRYDGTAEEDPPAGEEPGSKDDGTRPADASANGGGGRRGIFSRPPRVTPEEQPSPPPTGTEIEKAQRLLDEHAPKKETRRGGGRFLSRGRGPDPDGETPDTTP